MGKNRKKEVEVMGSIKRYNLFERYVDIFIHIKVIYGYFVYLK